MGNITNKADERGVPSLVWRAGQNRRLDMITHAVGELLNQGCYVLVNGCGIGIYNRALLRFTSNVYGLDIEAERILEGSLHAPNLMVAEGEKLPYPTNRFDVVLSHEVIEHVSDDKTYAAEMVRVLKPGGRGVIFCPNRWYPFETHGHYWHGQYHFGNTPFINYLPDTLRNKLAPHVRAYTISGLQHLFSDLPITIISHTQIYPGYDKIVQQKPRLGNLLRQITYAFEQTPCQLFGLSHLLVIEKYRTMEEK